MCSTNINLADCITLGRLYMRAKYFHGVWEQSANTFVKSHFQNKTCAPTPLLLMIICALKLVTVLGARDKVLQAK